MKITTYYENSEIISTNDYTQTIKKLMNQSPREKAEQYTLHKYAFLSGAEECENPSRYYLCIKSNEEDFVYLERKNMRGNAVTKQHEMITVEEADRILDEDIEWMKEDDRILVREFYWQMVLNQYRCDHVTKIEREVYLHQKKEYVIFDKSIYRTKGDFSRELLREGDVKAVIRKAKTLPIFWENMLPGAEHPVENRNLALT